MERNISWCRWICAPTGVSTFTAFCLFLVSVLLVLFMGIYFDGVINDNSLIDDNPMNKMITQASSFVQSLKKNASGDALSKEFPWLNHFEILISANCNIITPNLKRLRHVGYVMGVYNTFLMHILLNGLLPVSLISCLPIFASVLSNYAEPSMTVLLGILEFSQIFLSVVIVGTFILVNEKKDLLENTKIMINKLR
jgi:hypothetical protein